MPTLIEKHAKRLALWKEHGGEFHGPHVETAHIPERKFWGFLDALVAAEAADSLARLEARVEALEKEAEWQPIETAPPNRIVLCFGVTDRAEDGTVRNWKMATGVRFENLDELEWDNRRLKEYDHQPTHWRPLPNPPGATP